MLALLLLLAGRILPRTELSPGVVALHDRAVVCSVKWGLDRRHVTKAMKRLVLERYGHTWADHAHFEIDHLIPRELGGADDILNLWPQPWPDAHTKDKEENRLHRAVCAGTVSLDDAQAQMRQWP